MTAVASKLPANDRPLINDPDLARALEQKVAPLTGKPLERAQAAIRKVRSSGVQGMFSVVLKTYADAIDAAVGVADK